MDRFISWLYTRQIWGDRCSAYEPDCHCCKAWRLHDWLFNEGPEPEDQEWTPSSPPPSPAQP